MSQQVNDFMNELMEAIKLNEIDKAEAIYNNLEDLVGEAMAEKLFSQIEFKLLN